MSPVGHVMILLFGLGLASIGAVQLLYSSQVQPLECPSCPEQTTLVALKDIAQEKQTASESATASTQMVDVAGAVKKPGLHTVSKPARVADAILKAGGFTSDANSAYIAQQLNLATKLEPDSKIYIPSNGEEWSQNRVMPIDSESQSQTAPTNTIININTADTKSLMSLVGVGEVTATKIISNRPYSNIDELVEKKVVTETVFNKISSSITSGTE